MRKSILKIEDSVKSNIVFPKYPHSAVITRQTGCGKTLFVLDLLDKESSATKELATKKDMLSQLAFSGRHAQQSVLVISQRYISVLKDLREQAKWLCMFYTKDRDSSEHCLRKNYVVPADERQKITKKRTI